MNFETLLKPTSCECGRVHNCEIERAVIKKGAIAEIGALLEPYNKILIVADDNTYSVCGESVAEQLCGKIAKQQIFDVRHGILIPDERAVADIRSKVNSDVDLILGIGSGVIQDLCKYVSFREKLPYAIVATAPSMDGYASVSAAMTFDNMKVTYTAHTPRFIIADTEVLAAAPTELIVSGYGDIIGKFSCLNDWKLSAVVNGEYFCETIYNLTYDMLMRVKDLGPKLLARDESAIQTLTEALIGVGIAMAYSGNSRPASGSEHHMSHFFEVLGIMNSRPYFRHGIDVAYSAVCTQIMREQLLKLDEPSEAEPFHETAWRRKIKEIYGIAADEVIDLQTKWGRYKSGDIKIYQTKWHDIKAALAEPPSSIKMKEYLKSVALDFSDFESMYGKEMIDNAVWFAKDLRDRYSVLWPYYTMFYKS